MCLIHALHNACRNLTRLCALNKTKGISAFPIKRFVLSRRFLRIGAVKHQNKEGEGGLKWTSLSDIGSGGEMRSLALTATIICGEQCWLLFLALKTMEQKGKTVPLLF